ncbi:MAG TPA: helix-turn-helix domain-containing protein, partial [Chthonomonadales bacterium]|nr:helix-turn-helix domain-containing protein [Chthonomonadales bacterium]
MAPRTRLNTPEMRARVGERIKVAAAQAGLTLKLLAQSAGVTPGLVYQYVRGITAVPDDVLERIAAVTRVHIDFFNPEKDHRAGFTQPIESAAQVESESNRDPATRAAIHAELRHLQALAAAQKHPKQDRAAYTESLLQMLALARTIQNRQQEGWILWMLGIARFEAGELDEARQNLLAARELFDQESMKEYSALAALDLARLLAEQGAFDAAEKYLQDLLPAAGATISWRTFISLASLRYRQYDFGGALTLLARAAEQIQTVDPEEKERDAMPLLITHLADVVRATGHPEQAMMLWSKCLNQAAQDRRADWFLEALMEVAACCQQLGRMSEARQRLELAVVLAGFLFEDEARLGIARSLLADVLTAMGNVEEGRSAARASQRIASKVRAARPTILAALAVAEASLASGQPEDALVYAQEALEEARRTKRTREVARAREVRARACLLQWDRRTRAQDSAGAQSALAEAFSEASSALEMAQKAESVHDVIAARLSLARSAMARGSFSEADSEITEVLRLTGEGAIGLSR